MDRWFKTEDGKIVDIVDHTKDEISAKDELKVYIGTDSQNSGGLTFYTTAVVYRYGIRGCHFVTKSIEVPAIKDIYLRLCKETELTIAAAQLIDSEVPIKFEALEFDYNGRITTASTRAIEFARGWAQSLNYKPVVKPGPMIASKAADKICRVDADRKRGDLKRCKASSSKKKKKK